MKKRNQAPTKNGRIIKKSAQQKPPPPTRQLSDLEVTTLDVLYCHFGEKPFPDAMASFAGLADLLAENEAPEVQGLRQMVAGERVLNQNRGRALAL